MRYSYEFKLMCVELYHSGSYPDIPEGANPDTLKRHIREWSGLVDLHGPEVLKHKVFNKVWTPEEKLELVLKVIAGIPRRKVAIEAGINSGMLYQWVYKYKSQGYNGLVESKKGRPTKESRMKKSTNPLPLTESEREELIRLRAENEYIKAENEVIKKTDRLEARKMGCATQGEKAAIIKDLREKGYQLKYLLKAMHMARSTYYFEISRNDVVAERNQEILEEIKSVFVENKRRYGVRRVHQELINRGYQVNHKRVQRLMHEAGLVGKRPKEKYHSYKGEVGKIADNIIDRDFSTTLPLQKRTTDVSQFNFSWGKCYISPVLDMNTNEIISYDLAMSPNLEQIKRMLNKAFEKFPSVEGLIFHSDQGWQYQHAYFRNALQEHGIIQSMSRKGNCYDNCIMETFFGRLKNEMYYGYEKNYSSFEEFSQAVEEYIDYYNNKRIQAKTKWMPPVQYRIASMCSA